MVLTLVIILLIIRNHLIKKFIQQWKTLVQSFVSEYNPIFGYNVSDKIYMLFDKGKVGNIFNKDSRLYCSRISSLATFFFNVSLEDLDGQFIFECKAFNIKESDVFDYFKYHCYYKNKKNFI